MGYYIPGPAKGKADYIIEKYGASRWSEPSRPPKWEEINASEAIICVIDNGPFEAAAFCYSEKELEAFSQPDRGGGIWINGEPTEPDSVGHQRPRTWLIMDRAQAIELTCFDLIQKGKTILS